jgi:hypothetical protein
MVFGAKKEPQPPKPQAERSCPFPYPSTAGTYAHACMGQNCAWWQDDAKACAVNVLAKAASQTQ